MMLKYNESEGYGYHALLDNIEKLQEEDYLLMRDNVRKLYYEKFTKEAFVTRLEDED